jgi:hypothetical protein
MDASSGLWLDTNRIENTFLMLPTNASCLQGNYLVTAGV